MRHGASLLFATALLSGCSGEFVEPVDIRSSFVGRALGTDGEPIEGIGVYLVQRNRAAARVTTAPDGTFVLPTSPNERYTIVLHDGAGLGYVLTDTTSESVPTELGDFALRSLKEWPGLVLVDGIGYERRLTDFPGGLSYDSLPYLGAYNRLVASDEDGGRGALYRFDTETGSITLIHDDIVDDGEIINEWLSKRFEDDALRTDVFRRLTDGRELHRVPWPARVLFLDENALWLVEPVEFDIDPNGNADPIYDWRITRISSDGARRQGPLLFREDGRSPHNICLPTFGQTPFWAEADEVGRCLSGTLREVDLDTLESLPVPDRPLEPTFTVGADAFRVRLNPSTDWELLSWAPDQEEPTVEAWFDCPRCGDDLVNVMFEGEAIAISIQGPSLEASFRISDVRNQQHRWIGPSVTVEGQQGELFKDAETAAGPYGYQAEGLRLLSAPARTNSGTLTWVLELAPDGEVREEFFVPFMTCVPVFASPTGRWLSAIKLTDSGECVEHVRQRADRGAAFLPAQFVSARWGSTFVDGDTALVRLALDPLTGTQQLFRFELPEDRR